MKAKVTQKVVNAAKPAAKPYEIRDTVLPGFMCRVQPSGRKSYIVQYARGRRMTIGNAAILTPAQARNKAHEILGQAAEGVDPAQEKRKEKASTLRDYVENEYRPWARQRKKHGDQWCDQILRVFADLVDQPLTEITEHKVDRIRTQRLNDGAKPSTVNRNVTCLRGALTQARKAGYIDAHPLADMSQLPVDSRVTRYLSDDENKRLRAALSARDTELREGRDRGNEWRSDRGRELMPGIPLDGFGDHLTPLVLLSLNTGIRRGEAFGLEWQNVNFNTPDIVVNGKTGMRHVPLNDEAVDVLARWHQQSTGRLVFAGRDGCRLDNVRKSWAGVLKGAGIARFRWHDLRHTFASWLVMRGVDLNTVRELLGHGDIKMTLRYAHLAPAHKAEAVARLSL